MFNNNNTVPLKNSNTIYFSWPSRFKYQGLWDEDKFEETSWRTNGVVPNQNTIKKFVHRHKKIPINLEHEERNSMTQAPSFSHTISVQMNPTKNGLSSYIVISSSCTAHDGVHMNKNLHGNLNSSRVGFRLPNEGCKFIFQNVCMIKKKVNLEIFRSWKL
jgi:hypothetical protein